MEHCPSSFPVYKLFNNSSLNIEDLTLVVISYETSVRFCLSNDPLKRDFIAFKLNFISIRKRIGDTDVVSDVTCSGKVLLHVQSYDFYDTTLSAE